MKRIIILLCLSLLLSGCSIADTQQEATPGPSDEIPLSAFPAPTSAISQPVSILSAVEEFMIDYGYECDDLMQIGETYMTPDYMLAVIQGTYIDSDKAVVQLHLAHLNFADRKYQVVNLYPGNIDQSKGLYPNVVNLNGETVIWTTLNPSADKRLHTEQVRIYYSDNTYETVPMVGDSAVYRFKNGVQVTKFAPLNENGEEIAALTASGEALQPLANITNSIGAQLHPLTGEVIGICGYPTAPDMESTAALDKALQESSLLESRSEHKVVAAKEYSGRLYACITYTRNDTTVYELIVANLTIEGKIQILGVCEFTPPTEKGYQMYSTAIDNDVICWTLLNETRLSGTNSVLMDFNAFRLYWENNDYKDDLVVDRFFIYVNKYISIPTKCAPIINGNTADTLSSDIINVIFRPVN